ncbi:P-loop containing nucleoside triphosphate hydrolase protein [Phlebopus sp. FC_14]|nr:P-loop containing nucleoside triphosphate hydrolase protein [Phlebopus sp. FC_14]
MSPSDAYNETSSCGGDCGVDFTQESHSHNVLLFGETGVGKSSVINMLVGKEVAEVSSGATGCTFSCERYETNLNGRGFVLWDTIGLNEGDFGRIPPDDAERRLKTLMRTVEDGLSLLIYVIRGTRYREILRINYDLFYRGLCGGRVPVVVVITGLENEQSMDSWWYENKDVLGRNGMEFKDKACVTTIRGKPIANGGCMFDEEYEESERKVKELIVQNYLPIPAAITGKGGDEHSKSSWLEGRLGTGSEINGHHQGHEKKSRIGKFIAWLHQFLAF